MYNTVGYIVLLNIYQETIYKKQTSNNKSYNVYIYIYICCKTYCRKAVNLSQNEDDMLTL